MALNIKDPETDALARRLASLANESLTAAVHTALAERLARLERAQRQQRLGPRLERYIARGRARATLDTRPADQIVGYDADGLPS